MRFRRRKKRTPPGTLAVPLALGGTLLAAAGFGHRAYRHSRLFCPSGDPVKSWDPLDYGVPRGSFEEHRIATPGGERLHAWYCRAAEPRASAVFCHGNTGNLTTSAAVIPHLLAAGLSVLFFDYRGFGQSGGRPTARGVVSDGLAAAHFHDTIRPRDLPAVLYGYSLGGAVAAQVIRRHPFDGLILQSTFTSLAQLTRLLHPRAPLHLLAGDLFDTLRVVRRLDVPLLVLHGTDDEVIPCSMAGQLFDACRAPRRIHRVEGGLHKDIFERDPASLVREISTFVGSLAPLDRVEAGQPASFERWMNGLVSSLLAGTGRKRAPRRGEGPRPSHRTP